MKTTILGCGAWGTGIASVLQKNCSEVCFWTPQKEEFDYFATHRGSSKIPGCVLQKNVSVTMDIREAVEKSSLIVICIPVPFIRSVCIQNASIFHTTPILSASKGIEENTGLFVTQVLESVLPTCPPLAALSGPNFAKEIAEFMPSSTSIACDPSLQDLLKKNFNTECFRILFTNDIIGVQVAGALKNVFAILSGIATELGYGLSSIACLLTQGIQEMALFAEQKGGNPLTLLDFSGVGDLILTCLGSLSRNHTFGTYLGKGFSVESALEKVGTVEGVLTTLSISQSLSFKDMPVTQAAYRILYDHTNPKAELQALLSRELD